MQLCRLKLGWQENAQKWSESAVKHAFLDMSELPYMTPPSLAAIQFFHGVALFSVKRTGDALESFRRALALTPNDVVIEECTQLLKAWMKASNRLSVHHTSLGEMIALLPKTPLLSQVWRPQTALVSVDAERRLLRAIGYSGDLLEFRIVQKQGHYINQHGVEKRGVAGREVEDRKIADTNQELDEHLKRHRMPKRLCMGGEECSPQRRPLLGVGTFMPGPNGPVAITGRWAGRNLPFL